MLASRRLKGSSEGDSIALSDVLLIYFLFFDIRLSAGFKKLFCILICSSTNRDFTASLKKIDFDSEVLRK
jgi:hypothetical protein